MTQKEVTTHPVFLRLSDNDKQFITELMNNGNDKRSAAHATWKCKDDASADSMANKALRKPPIRYLTDEFFGVSVTRKIPSREELAAVTWERANKTSCSDADYFKLSSMVADLMGYKTKPQEAPPDSTSPNDDSHEEFV